ncbi:MAG: ROK family protein [Pseudomonadota bacterium]
MSNDLRIGIDLGGTKIEAIAMDLHGVELQRLRLPTPVNDYQAALRTVATLVAEIEQELGGKGQVGVATPGSLSPTSNRMRNANSTWLNDQKLDRDLIRILKRPVRMANDADCFVLSEIRDGVARHAKSVFGVILGTGVGGGIAIEGRLMLGHNRIAGEWGHNPMPWAKIGEFPGPDCHCGKRGCIETFLSGPGLSEDHWRATSDRLSPQEIEQLACQGDERAETSLRRYEDRLARGLASVINVLDPEIIVLGGGLSNLARLYGSIPQRWLEFVFSDQVTTRLLPPQHGDASGARGAAWLWDEASSG